MSELVTVTIKNHVADVCLNRPDKMNALSIPMFEAITATAKEIAANRDVRAVVLSGSGPIFCAGIDLNNFTDGDAFSDPFGPGRGGFTPNFYQSAAWIWRDIPAPVICALHGAAYGGGLQIALGADIRIAHPQTKLSVMEIKWGLVPDMTASQTLRDLVRLDVAKELTFTGRIVEAEEAQRIGLVTSLHDSPRESALAMAATIAQSNPDAISYGKYLLNTCWHGNELTGLTAEEEIGRQLLNSENQAEAVRSQMEKRKANFSARRISNFNDINFAKV